MCARVKQFPFYVRIQTEKRKKTKITVNQEYTRQRPCLFRILWKFHLLFLVKRTSKHEISPFDAKVSITKNLLFWAPRHTEYRQNKNSKKNSIEKKHIYCALIKHFGLVKNKNRLKCEWVCVYCVYRSECTQKQIRKSYWKKSNRNKKRRKKYKLLKIINGWCMEK